MPRPPRRDRAAVFGGADGEGVEDVAAQSPAVGVADMGDPALDGGIQLGKADFARMIGREPRPQPAVGVAHLARLDQAMVGWTMKPSQGMPSSMGSTCARLAWMTRRSPASRAMIAAFHDHNCRLLSAKSAKSST